MTNKTYINPQPWAVERENKNLSKEKPSNLAGTELEKKSKKKSQPVAK